MPRLKRLLVILLLILACVGCDQTSKSIAKQYLPESEIITLMKDTVRLHYVRNSGAFLSMGASWPTQVRTVVFTVGVTVIVAAVFFYLLFAPSISKATVIGLSLICGGGIGNLIDRIAYDGAVVDFLNLGIGPLRTGIFNIADVAVSFGAILILWDHVRTRRAANPRLG